MKKLSVIILCAFASSCSQNTQGINEELQSSQQLTPEELKSVTNATMVVAKAPRKSRDAELNESETIALTGDESAGDLSLQFQFLVDKSGIWKWNQPENQGELEYSWNIEFLSGSKSYRVGYNQFSFSENGQGQGSFDQLIAEQGQADLWILDKDPGIWSLEEDIPVEAKVNHKGLLITIPPGPFVDGITTAKVANAKLLVEGAYLDYLELPIQVTQP